MRRPLFFLIAAVVLIVDQITKQLIVRTVSQFDHIQIVPSFCYITLVTNTGAAFGAFQHTPILLAITAVAAIVGIVYYVSITQWPVPTLIGLGATLPLGGALGNLIDRVRLGYVVDFIEIRLGSYTWPIFNVADSAICVGVALLIVASLRTPTNNDTVSEGTRTL